MSAVARNPRILVISLAMLSGMLLVARRATAGQYSGGIPPTIVVLTPVAIVDVTFTGYDVIKGIQGESASKGMASAEFVLAMPQLLVGTVISLDFVSHGGESHIHELGRDDFWPILAYTAWMGGLTAHGIATLCTFTQPSLPDPHSHVSLHQVAAAEPKVDLAPTLLGDPSKVFPGLVAFGRF
jgi:hypothetical protein